MSNSATTEDTKFTKKYNVMAKDFGLNFCQKVYILTFLILLEKYLHCYD